MTHSEAATLHGVRYRLLTEHLADLLDTLLAGEIVNDRATAERLVRLVSAATSLNERHAVDGRGRCTVCREASTWRWRLWQQRLSCSVYETLSQHMTQPPLER